MTWFCHFWNHSKLKQVIGLYVGFGVVYITQHNIKRIETTYHIYTISVLESFSKKNTV